EERNPERQINRLDDQLRTDEPIHRIDDERRVLEVAERQQIERDTRGEHTSSSYRCIPARPQTPSQEEVKHHGAKKDSEVLRRPPPVEEQGGQGEPPDVVYLAPQARACPKAEKRDGQKQEDENVGFEQHTARHCPLLRRRAIVPNQPDEHQRRE